MRVLIVHPYMSLYGGAELVVVKLANFLTKKEISNAVVTLSILPRIKEELKGTTVFLPQQPVEKPKNFLFTLLLLKKLVSTIFKKFDVINLHNFPAELISLGMRRPCVWMCNEPPVLYFRDSLIARLTNRIVLEFDRFLLKRYIQRVVVADEFNAQRFKKLYGVCPDVIHYGVDYEFFSRGNAQRARKIFNISKDEFVLLQVGMLTPFKNQLESIKTLEKLKNKIPNLRLILAGKGEKNYEKILKDYVRQHGLTEYVTFTGHLSREVIRDLYKISSVALYPVKEQGGWLSPFEALCAGTPIIVSTVITSANLIKKNNLGTITNNFVNAVLEVYENQKHYQFLAKKAKLWVKNNLTWNRFCERMVEIFEKYYY